MESDDRKIVMMVEDDPFLSDLLLHKLSKTFHCLHAATGPEAIEILKHNQPDVILLDLVLPGIDGFEILRQIKANQKTAPIPVVIFSNLGQDEDIKKAKQLGALEYVVKVTLLPDEVVTLVQSVLARTHAKIA
jgi:CheY-like chemotaxis protein